MECGRRRRLGISTDTLVFAVYGPSYICQWLTPVKPTDGKRALRIKIQIKLQKGLSCGAGSFQGLTSLRLH
jgi:hypothetical protein